MGYRKYDIPEGKVNKVFWACGQIIGALIWIPISFVIFIIGSITWLICGYRDKSYKEFMWG